MYCPCAVSRSTRVCRRCQDSPYPQRGVYTTDVVCHNCGFVICLDHSDDRAVAQQICQTCLNGAEYSSSEEELQSQSDDDGNEFEDENVPFDFFSLSNNMGSRHRILPQWMRRSQPGEVHRAARHSLVTIHIPRYLRSSSEPHVVNVEAIHLDPETGIMPPPPAHPLASRGDEVNLDLRETCAVCLVEFEAKENVQHLSCHASHMFHANCIQSWWQRSRTCPLCKMQ